MRYWRALTRSGCIAVLGVACAMACAAAAETVSDCAEVPHGDHPKALLTNGKLDALVFLPDAKNGYYRSTRFDWSGVISSLRYQGHEYFGQWFDHYDPNIHDAITGPVEEFLTREAGLGYQDAKPGGSFIRIGVGVVRKFF